MVWRLLILADSSLPRPHGRAHIGHALFFSKTATTGVNVAGIVLAVCVLGVLGLAALIAVHKLDDVERRRDRQR